MLSTQNPLRGNSEDNKQPSDAKRLPSFFHLKQYRQAKNESPQSSPYFRRFCTLLLLLWRGSGGDQWLAHQYHPDLHPAHLGLQQGVFEHFQTKRMVGYSRLSGSWAILLHRLAGTIGSGLRSSTATPPQITPWCGPFFNGRDNLKQSIPDG